MPGVYRFANRTEAGQKLANALSSYAGRTDVLVLALPRGGVPVAYEVAKALGLPMDVWLVRKLGVPGQEELALGALAGNNIRVLNHEILDLLGISGAAVDAVAAKEQVELERRNAHYRGGRPPPETDGKTVIIVDDGLATGATMRVAITSIRRGGAARIVVAVPVGAASTCSRVESESDELVCLQRPEPFYGVGQWYSDFSQTSDEDVLEILKQPTVNTG